MKTLLFLLFPLSALLCQNARQVAERTAHGTRLVTETAGALPSVALDNCDCLPAENVYFEPYSAVVKFSYPVEGFTIWLQTADSMVVVSKRGPAPDSLWTSEVAPAYSIRQSGKFLRADFANGDWIKLNLETGDASLRTHLEGVPDFLSGPDTTFYDLPEAEAAPNVLSVGRGAFFRYPAGYIFFLVKRSQGAVYISAGEPGQNAALSMSADITQTGRTSFVATLCGGETYSFDLNTGDVYVSTGERYTISND